MYELKKEFWISCSHRLNNNDLSEIDNKCIFGKCNNLPCHGHNYRIILILRCDTLQNGMVMNFDVIKNKFKMYIDDIYDHQFLNNCPKFNNVIPTAENMAKIFYNILSKQISVLYAVEIYETQGASAKYWEE